MDGGTASQRQEAASIFEFARENPLVAGKRALALRERLAPDDHAARCYVEQTLAFVAVRAGDMGSAATHSLRADALARTLDRGDAAVGDCAATRVMVLALRGSDEEFREAVRLGRPLASGASLGRLLTNWGIGEQLRGKHEVAAAALAEAEQTVDEMTRPSVRNNRAIVELQLGELERAEEGLRSVAAVAERTTLRLVAEANLSLVELATGRIADGLERFDRTEQALAEMGFDPLPARLDRCHIVLDLGLVDEAAAMGLSLLRGNSDRIPERASTLLAVLRALALGGEQAGAIRLAQSVAASGLRGQREDLGRLIAWLDWAGGSGALPASRDDTLSVELALIADLADAPWAMEALDQLHADGSAAPERWSVTDAVLRALVASHAGDLGSLRDALDCCADALRRGDPSDLAEGRIWYERMERIAFTAADRADDAGAAAFAVSAGRRMGETLASWGRAMGSELESLLRQRRVLAVAPTGETGEAARAARLDELEQRIATRVAALGRSHASERPPATAEIGRGWLGTSVVFRVSRGRIVALVDDGGAGRLVRLGAVEEVLAVVENARQSATAQLLHPRARSVASSWERAITAVDDAVMRPLGLEPGRPIAVLCCAELATVTWGVLPSLRGTDVRLSDSLDVAAPPTIGRTAEAVLVGGPRLDHVHEELDAIAGFWPGARRAEGSEATAARAIEMLAHSEVAHIGAHGDLRGDAPLFSHLSLADGPLTLGDLHQAPRLPRSVVLSACRLGGGAGRRRPTWPVSAALGGRECRSVVVSVLPVLDVAVAPFMARLHQGLSLGSSPSVALAAAHCDALDRGDLGCIGFVEIATPGPR